MLHLRSDHPYIPLISFLTTGCLLIYTVLKAAPVDYILERYLEARNINICVVSLILENYEGCFAIIFTESYYLDKISHHASGVFCFPLQVFVIHIKIYKLYMKITEKFAICNYT